MRVVTKDIILTQQQLASIFRKEYGRSVGPWLFTVGSMFVVLMLTVYGFLVRRDFAVMEAWRPFLGLVILWWVFIIGYMPWSMARSPLLARLRITSRLTFTPDNIEQEFKDGATKRVPYLTFAKIKIRDRHVLLYDQDGSIMVVPSDAFGSQEEADQVYSLLRLTSRLRPTQ